MFWLEWVAQVFGIVHISGRLRPGSERNEC